MQVTFGATEAIAAALLGLCDPGDEVVSFEPYYDSYAAGIAMAGAVRRPVTLRPPDWAFDARGAGGGDHGARARVLLLNSPHNPTGKVFSREELELVAAACLEHDLIAITDEVYEHLVFDGEHVPLSHAAGDGRAHADDLLARQDVLRHGLEDRLGDRPRRAGGGHAQGQAVPHLRGRHPVPARRARWRCGSATRPTRALARELRAKRDRLCDGPRGRRAEVLRPAGTYFANADCGRDGVAYCRELVERAGVVAIPTSVFYDSRTPATGSCASRSASARR